MNSKESTLKEGGFKRMNTLRFRKATAEQRRAKKQKNMEYWNDGILEYRTQNGVKPEEGNIVWPTKSCFSHFPSFHHSIYPLD